MEPMRLKVSPGDHILVNGQEFVIPEGGYEVVIQTSGAGGYGSKSAQGGGNSGDKTIAVIETSQG